MVKGQKMVQNDKNFCLACCDSYSSNTTRVQLQMIQYIFQIKILSKNTPTFHRWDWLKNERDNEVEMQCSMSNTKYGECE